MQSRAFTELAAGTLQQDCFVACIAADCSSKKHAHQTSMKQGSTGYGSDGFYICNLSHTGLDERLKSSYSQTTRLVLSQYAIADIKSSTDQSGCS